MISRSKRDDDTALTLKTQSSLPLTFAYEVVFPLDFMDLSFVCKTFWICSGIHLLSDDYTNIL